MNTSSLNHRIEKYKKSNERCVIWETKSAIIDGHRKRSNTFQALFVFWSLIFCVKSASLASTGRDFFILFFSMVEHPVFCFFCHTEKHINVRTPHTKLVFLWSTVGKMGASPRDTKICELVLFSVFPPPALSRTGYLTVVVHLLWAQSSVYARCATDCFP